MPSPLNFNIIIQCVIYLKKKSDFIFFYHHPSGIYWMVCMQTHQWYNYRAASTPAGLRDSHSFRKKIPQFSEKGAGFIPHFEKKSRTHSNLVRVLVTKNLLKSNVFGYYTCIWSVCVRMLIKLWTNWSNFDFWGRNIVFGFTL